MALISNAPYHKIVSLLRGKQLTHDTNRGIILYDELLLEAAELLKCTTL
jgi:hypothetical protein